MRPAPRPRSARSAAPPRMRPLRVRHPAGSSGSWRRLLREMDECGWCVLYATVSDWVPGGPGAADGGRASAAWGPADRRRLERLRRPELRDRFVASRMLLTSAAAAVLGVRAQELELAHEPGGRPRLRGIGQLEVSLSHTGALVTVGLSAHGRIGVDVEAAGRPMLELGTEHQMCVPEELRRLRCLPERQRNRELVRLWTLKEAYSKAIGQGLRFPFTEFGFAADAPGRTRLLRRDGSAVPDAEWSFHSRLVEGTHWISGAFHDPGFGGGAPRAAGRGGAESARTVHSRSSSR